MSEQLRVAVIGCGNISGAYGETIGAYPSVRIAGATDVDPALSAAFVDRFGGVDYPSLDDVLGDPAVDAIVNLTYPGVHAEVTTAALEAGKHVHSREAARTGLRERPLARRPGRRAEPEALVLADHVHGRGAGDDAAPRRRGRDRHGARRLRGGELEPHRELAPSPRALLPHRSVRGRRRVSADDPHRHVRPGSPGHGVREDRVPRSHDDIGRALLPGSAGLRRRSRRAGERNGRATHGELLRRPPQQAERNRAPRRHGLALPLELAGVRRHGRARAVRRLVRGRCRWRTPSAGPTGDGRSAT